jgi:hypothetical protein
MESAKLNATMFGVSEEEGQRATEMQKELTTEVKVDPSQLTGMEKMMGVKVKDITELMQKTNTTR